MSVIRARRVVAALLLAGLVAGWPSVADAATRRHKTSTVANRYVVVLHDDADSDAVARDHAQRYGAKVTHVYRRAVHGYAAKLSSKSARKLATHVPGTSGGTSAGVAKAVRLVAVRVLGCKGEGTVSDVIAGVDWVTTNHVAGQPAVANMSLGGGVSPTLDKAVARSVADGVA